MTVKLRVISLGAGVQSTALALMAAAGEIGPMPDCAIFADTQDEGAATYAHLRWLISVLPFPVYRPTRGRLSDALFAGDDEARIPAFVGAGGLAKRQCTRNFKIRVIRRQTREILGVGPRGYIAPGGVEQWIGISLDEFERVTSAGVRFIVNRYPLIEQRRSRLWCERWLKSNGHVVPPKSACVYCAYQSDDQWRARKQGQPSEFAMACGVDAGLRTPENIKRFHGELYLHPSRKPLAEIDFSTPAPSPQLNLFNNECEGMCGV